jgi:very-short-patch-repair endonuclease
MGGDVTQQAHTPGPSPASREGGNPGSEASRTHPSPALRERGGPQARGEGTRAPRTSKSIRQAAREFRRAATPTEQLLWEALRNNRLGGHKFRRQHPVGRFVLDFYCHEERLAIEVNGGIHQRQQVADRERQETLESMGIRFIRLPAERAQEDLPGALEAIQQALTTGPSPASRERVEALPGGPR